jgi:fructose-bisphosphate aldolase class II
MPLVVDRSQVLDIYAEAEEKKWVLPTFNVENLTSCEAILEAVDKFGQSKKVNNLPIIIGITNRYPSRPQTAYYTHTRNWKVGMRLFLDDLDVLTSKESPYHHLRVMIHIDHMQWDLDEELQNWDMNCFSSLMYDASTLPFEQNIEKTSSFVKKYKKEIIIEGASDEIGATRISKKTWGFNAEQAEKYYRETGIDLIVADLGTEHRTDHANLSYKSELAREITRRIGPKLCLHGTSSVTPDKLNNLFDDGIRKVNVWTILERDGAKSLFHHMIENASKIVGPERANELYKANLLGEKSTLDEPLSLDYFPTTYRQEIIFRSMIQTITDYLYLWYK